MSHCKCGSYAINHHLHGRDGSDSDLCDVCYWRKRANRRQQVPEGMVLVPKEPSSAMLDAGVAMALQVSVQGQGGWSNYIRGLYQQMLSAAHRRRK